MVSAGGPCPHAQRGHRQASHPSEGQGAPGIPSGGALPWQVWEEEALARHLIMGTAFPWGWGQQEEGSGH